jgi:4-diphosphocytidyl-2-C-methyl-D-erythritol kinase
MIIFPKAKINLGLRITRKRPDGFHDIETLFYPVGLSDAIEFVVSADPLKKDILKGTGIDPGSNPEDNLVIKTVKKLREKYSFPFLKIHLHKAIPVGAGLGGGSSDAAFIMKAVNRFFNLNIEINELRSVALELGSDCPFFIDCVPAFATGRGEILRAVNSFLTGYYIILLNPSININTKEAYQNCRPEVPSTNLFTLIDKPIKKWKDLIINDFEEYAFKKHPFIKDIKTELYNSGALFSLMSGSGSTVYGVFSGRSSVPDTLKDFVIYEGVM